MKTEEILRREREHQAMSEAFGTRCLVYAMLERAVDGASTFREGLKSELPCTNCIPNERTSKEMRTGEAFGRQDSA